MFADSLDEEEMMEEFISHLKNIMQPSFSAIFHEFISKIPPLINQYMSLTTQEALQSTSTDSMHFSVLSTLEGANFLHFFSLHCFLIQNYGRQMANRQINLDYLHHKRH